MDVRDRRLLLPVTWNTYPETVRNSLNLAIIELTTESSGNFAVLDGCDIRWFFLIFYFERPCSLRYVIYRLTPDIHGEKAIAEELRKE